MDKKALSKNILTFLILFSLILIVSFFLSHGLGVKSESSGNGIDKNYDSIKNNVLLTNSTSSVPIANIRLNTPIVYNVIRGKNRLVAEFTVDNYASTSNVFNNLEFYDAKNNMGKINRVFTYKYQSFENVEVPDYQINCKERMNVNGTMEQYDCTQVQSGSHTEQKMIWNNFDKNAILPKGNITLGIFTDVLPNDYIEWVPTLFGVRISEWAAWNETFNDGLIDAWKFDENIGTFTNSSVNGLPGKIYGSWVGGGKDNSAIIGRANITNSPLWKDVLTDYQANYTISFWINTASITDNEALIGAGNDPYFFSIVYYNIYSEKRLLVNRNRINDGSSSRVGFRYFFNSTDVSSTGAGYINVVIVYYGNDSRRVSAYKNGIANYSSLGYPYISINNNALGADLTLNNNLTVGEGVDGSGSLTRSIDELYIWNRALSPSEAESLYDNGAGTFYQDLGNNPTNDKGYISWDGDFMASGDINSTGYSVNGQAGITDNVNFWMCKDSSCSTKCQVNIVGGIIVGCS